MLEGRKTKFLDSTKSLSSQDSFSLPQGDSIRNIQPTQSTTSSSSQVITTPKPASKYYTPAQLDSIALSSERRMQQINLHTSLPLKSAATYLPADTMATRYHQYNYPFSSPLPVTLHNEDNFLLNISSKTYMQAEQGMVDTVKVRKMAADTLVGKTPAPAEPSYMNGNAKVQTGMDWLVITLLFSLFVFSFMRMAYEKFIVQIVGSIVNYQMSVRLFRERNVLFKNISLGLNFIFALNLGLFVFYFVDFLGFDQILTHKFLSMLIYTVAIAVIYSVKSGVCKLLGFVFLVKEEFDEYVHNIRLFNKNIGLFLFPIVIVYPFIVDPIRPYILYTGLLVIASLFILRIYRGFQIIIKKGVSVFYLILYLCAIEILPVLLMIKLAASLI
jgi:hypothetical protein